MRCLCVVYQFVNVLVHHWLEDFIHKTEKYASQGAFASLQFGKRRLEKTRLFQSMKNYRITKHILRTVCDPGVLYCTLETYPESRMSTW